MIMEFILDVMIEETLKNQIKQISGLKKRFFHEEIDNFLRLNSNKVCVLYGLRRTSKTTSLYQSIEDLMNKKVKCAYIACKKNNDMSQLIYDLKLLEKQNYTHIFIDEITYLDNFIAEAHILSDSFATRGMKIFLSGTDSLGFLLSERQHFDRFFMIHTTFVPYREFSKVLDVYDVDDYIKYGGTFIEERNAFNSNYNNLFTNNEKLRQYLDSSIVYNIQNTLENYYDIGYFNELLPLYNANELTNLINRIIENANHELTLHTLRRQFKSRDYGSTSEIMTKNDSGFIPLNNDEKEVLIAEFMKKINVKNIKELKVSVTEEMIEKVYDYLYQLDFLRRYTVVQLPYENNYDRKKVNAIVQSGIRYSLAKDLIYTLDVNDVFNKKNKRMVVEQFKEKLLQDVQGRMLEEIVIIDVIENLKNIYYKEFPRYTIEQVRFKNGNGEIDIVIYDSKTYMCDLYEIKHTDRLYENQYQHLVNEDYLALIEDEYGKINKRYLLYKGDTMYQQNVDIYYKNVEEFLCELPIFPIRELYDKVKCKLSEEDKEFLLYSCKIIDVKEAYLIGVQKNWSAKKLEQIKNIESKEELKINLKKFDDICA